MPLVGAYTWSERADRVLLAIPLKGCAPSKVDIFCTASTLKVNYSPYLVDLVLHGKINAVKHKATVKEGVLHITLFKQESDGQLWGKLLAEEGEVAELRAKGVTDHAALQKELGEQRKERRIDDERYSLRKQMALEESEKSRLENLKAEEKAAAEEVMYKTFAELQHQQHQQQQQQQQQQQGAVAASASSTAAPRSAPVAAAAAVAAKQSGTAPASAPAPATGAASKSIFDSFLAADDIDTDQDEDEEQEPVPEGKSSSPRSQPAAAAAAAAAAGVVGGARASRVQELASSDDEDEDEDEPAATAQPRQQQLKQQKQKQLQQQQQQPHYADEDKEVRFVPPPRSIQLPAAPAADGADASDNTTTTTSTTNNTNNNNNSNSSSNSSSSGSARLSISFTPRLFPTPMRESKAAEEEDWIVKNRRHLKNHGVFGKGLKDVSEEDPTWLKAKGDDFFRGGDARSAVSAYSAAIDADPGLTSCYSNRSACYLKLGLYADCRADCSTAIAQIEAPAGPAGPAGNGAGAGAGAGVGAGAGGAGAGAIAAAQASTGPLATQTRTTLHKLLLRRSVASCHLGEFSAAIADQSRVLAAVEGLHSVGLTDTQATAGLTPAAILEDLRRLRLLGEADALKREGDTVLAESRLEEARGRYDAALGLLPFHVGSLANRSACRLAQGDVEGCVEDCSRALELLQLDPTGGAGAGAGGGGGGINMLSAVLPPAGSDKRLAWVTRTVARRGQALAQLGRLGEATRDYRRAAELNPGNQALQADLKAIEAAAAAAEAGAAAGAGAGTEGAAPGTVEAH